MTCTQNTTEFRNYVIALDYDSIYIYFWYKSLLFGSSFMSSCSLRGPRCTFVSVCWRWRLYFVPCSL
ncbi:hypothetical protein GDO81_004009 [Engystomops pustulosus]|uniref:Uncharacterized protein n=1 Tax=Engystomops pustulosus TaxID=76066 RepID=A0AAV6ZT82_ENGPU|nr:hypothetical protein GDO81_004009 [Engystomops pustulosus]